MKRRDALTVLAGLPLFAAPTLVAGQAASRVRRIGWLVSGWGEGVDELDQGLRRRGWVPGKNTTYEIRKAHGSEPELFYQYAMELVRLDVDLLVTAGDRATRAAMRATSTIPIVFFAASDPVKSGFVSSLSRPTGNVTGFAVFGDDQVMKRLEALHELVPQVRTIAVLIYGARTAESTKLEAPVEQAYAQFGIRPIFVYASTEAQTDSVINAAARQRVDALLLPATFYANASTIAAAAIRNRLPSLGIDPKLAEAGILLSLSADFDEQDEMFADLIDRILRGSKPADLAVRQATKFDIVVNAKTARALGIRVPQSLLVRARVVE